MSSNYLLIKNQLLLLQGLNCLGKRYSLTMLAINRFTEKQIFRLFIRFSINSRKRSRGFRVPILKIINIFLSFCFR